MNKSNTKSSVATAGNVERATLGDRPSLAGAMVLLHSEAKRLGLESWPNGKQVTPRISYDKTRHHLTATDRRAILSALKSIGGASSIAVTTGRNRYSITREQPHRFIALIQNNEGQYRVPFSLSPDKKDSNV